MIKKLYLMVQLLLLVYCENGFGLPVNEDEYRQKIDSAATNYQNKINFQMGQINILHVNTANDLINQANSVRNTVNSAVSSIYSAVNSLQSKGLDEINNNLRSKLTNRANNLRSEVNGQFNECQKLLQSRTVQWSTSTSWTTSLNRQYNQLINIINQMQARNGQIIDSMQNVWIKKINSMISNTNHNLNEMHSLITSHSNWMVQIMNNWESKMVGQINLKKQSLINSINLLHNQVDSQPIDSTIQSSFSDWIRSVDYLIEGSESAIETSMQEVDAFFNKLSAADEQRIQTWSTFHFEDASFYNIELQKSILKQQQLIDAEGDEIENEIKNLCNFTN